MKIDIDGTIKFWKYEFFGKFFVLNANGNVYSSAWLNTEGIVTSSTDVMTRATFDGINYNIEKLNGKSF